MVAPLTSLTTAQRRAYQQLCDASGRMLVVAMDQRGSMRTLIESPDRPVNDSDLVASKLDLVRYLGNRAPGVLLDPEFAVPQVVDEGILARDCALMVGMDQTGYATGDHGLRVSRVVDGINARRVRELGGTAGKMNLYLRPDVEGVDSATARLMRSVIEDFEREDALVVIEILTYALPDEDRDEFEAKSGDLVLGAAVLARECGAKVLKLQYPGSAEGCRAVTEALGDIPWAVLSAGVDHTTFLGRLEIALANGAQGAIAGRSLWKDCLSTDRAEQRRRLEELAYPRLQELQAQFAAAVV